MTEYFEQRSHRHLVRGLKDLYPVKVRDTEYDGVYLSILVSINPENALEESARTPQLIFELGRLVAAAMRDKQVLDMQYRVWRDTKIVSVTTDPDEAEAEGLSDGKKPAAKTVADVWVRTLPEYVVWQEKIAHAEEAWQTVFAALEAAKSRHQALFEFRRSGVDGQYGSGVPMSTAPRVEHPGAGNVYDNVSISAKELPAVENQVASSPRTPLPPRPPNTANPGPPPRPTSDDIPF